jgi:hypothetical protein
MTALVSGTALAAALDLTYATDTATFDQVADATDEWLVSLLSTTDADGVAIDHSTHSTCKEAAIAIAAEIYTARTAVGGSPMSADFTPGAYRLSVWPVKRVQGIVGRCFAMGGWVG